MEYRDPFARTDTTAYGQSQATSYDAGLRAYMLKVYNYMASALALTGLVALGASQSEAFMNMLSVPAASGGHSPSGLAWIIALAPLGLVMWLSFGVQRMSATMAQGIFWAYSALVGLSLTSIFIVYTGESIARTFFITAGTFGSMSLWGYTTKKDLTGMGSFLMMGLIGLILASLVNIFLQSSGLHFATSVIGVLIFVGLTAYDTQKLKNMYYQVAGGAMAKTAIMGALALYLDFINMFMYLLRFVGDRR